MLYCQGRGKRLVSRSSSRLIGATPVRAMNIQHWSPSGLHTAPRLPWGSHIAHFFRSGRELHELLVPYFKAGLENNEQCLWVTGESFNADEARSALRAAVPDLDRRERDQQIEIANGAQWYSSGQKLDPRELVRGLVQREQDALGSGYVGLRTSGDCAWVSQNQWSDFLAYERLVQQTVRGRRMICMCSYCIDRLRDGSEAEVLQHHDCAVRDQPSPRPPNLDGVGETAETDEAHELRRQLDRQKRTFDMAMLASDMGTWRYTLADTVCLYDANAQRLYGLTEARFLHDEEGVKSNSTPTTSNSCGREWPKPWIPRGTVVTTSNIGSSSTTAVGDGLARGAWSNSRATVRIDVRLRSPGPAGI
jgi:DcmR-like sensory protein